MKSSSLTVVILTFNEELHIERCINSLGTLPTRIVIVDSFSTDSTMDILRKYKVDLFQRNFINNADQFQWALDNCQIETDWIMKIDADERMEKELVSEIQGNLGKVPTDVGGIYLKRRQIYCGKWIRHGGRYPLKLLRIWRNGAGFVEQRWMDEHIIIKSTYRTITFKNDFSDDNLKGIDFWVAKHNNYATREAIEVLNEKYFLFAKDKNLVNSPFSNEVLKRVLKEKLYLKIPIGLRAVTYFLFRYIFQLGFLDGIKGLEYHFMQGLWYRLLVDLKVREIEMDSKGDVNKIKKILKEKYLIKLT